MKLINENKKLAPTEVSIIKIIRVVDSVGAGTVEDPIRQVASYWTLNGNLIQVLDDYQTKSDF